MKRSIFGWIKKIFLITTSVIVSLILLISLIALVFILIKFDVISFGEDPRKANTTGNGSTNGLQSNDEINPVTANKLIDSTNQSSVNKDSLKINNLEAPNNEQDNNP